MTNQHFPIRDSPPPSFWMHAHPVKPCADHWKIHFSYKCESGRTIYSANYLGLILQISVWNGLLTPPPHPSRVLYPTDNDLYCCDWRHDYNHEYGCQEQHHIKHNMISKVMNHLGFQKSFRKRALKYLGRLQLNVQYMNLIKWIARYRS